MAKATASRAAPPRPPQGILRFFTRLPAAQDPLADAHETPVAKVGLGAEQRAATPAASKATTITTSETSVVATHAPERAQGVEEEEQDKKEEEEETPAPSQVSEYERKRLARVAQNAQFLRELGLQTAQRGVRSALATPPAPGKKPKPTKRVRETSSEGMRRSTRLRGVKLAEKASEVPDLDHDEDPPMEELSFDDSSVFKYTCSRGEGSQASETASERPPGATLVGFRGSSVGLADPNLRRIYSISFSPLAQNALIAAGGHQGQVSIYASPRNPNDETGDDPRGPLMAFRAHRGWISSLSLAKSTVDKNLLLSAANDGVVKLWDLNRSASGVPQELLSVDDLHRYGIFGMDVNTEEVLTCSKDTTIALSRFREDASALAVSRRYDDHDGVVKCVRFSILHPNYIASGGNDKCVRVYDTRSASPVASQVIADAHSRAINSVAWHPTQENVLLSAGFDPDMHLYDLRKPAAPLHVLSTSASHAVGTSIFHPCFVSDGDYIVSTGSGSQDQLSLHRVLDGSTVSRGQLPAKASYVACDPRSGRLLVAMGQQLQFFEKEWAKI